MRIWRNASPNHGDTFAANWRPIGEGTFASSPAAICSFDGMTVYVAGRGLDNAIWWNVSTNGGQDWLEHWQRMQTGGIFSTPVLLAKGTEIELYGLGGDFRVWRNVSANQMVSWGDWQLAGSGVYLWSRPPVAPALREGGAGFSLPPPARHPNGLPKGEASILLIKTSTMRRGR